jgi:hypothetical protein
MGNVMVPNPFHDLVAACILVNERRSHLVRRQFQSKLYSSRFVLGRHPGCLDFIINMHEFQRTVISDILAARYET